MLSVLAGSRGTQDMTGLRMKLEQTPFIICLDTRMDSEGCMTEANKPAGNGDVSPMTQGPGHYCTMKYNERICRVQKDVEASAKMWE